MLEGKGMKTHSTINIINYLGEWRSVVVNPWDVVVARL